MLCELPDLPPELWAQLLRKLVKTLSGRDEEQQNGPSLAEEEPADRLEDLAEDNQGYAAAFAQLHNAAAAELDLLPGAPDAGQYLATSLAQLSKVCSERIPGM